MKRLLFVSILLTTQFTNAQQEKAYPVSDVAPHWVTLMYMPNTDPGAVIAAHDAYFKLHPKVKNEHTQYYKRWMRSFGRSVKFDPQSEADVNYMEKSIAQNQSKAPNSAWSCIGPWDFDIDAASRSYAPGAAHVYTVERSVSNTSIMYAGTSTAGLWKSIDGGQNWALLTRDLVLNSIFSIEIDFTDPNIVYFESGGNVYKTTDGGLVWNIIGDANFQANAHDVKDIVMSPTDNMTLYLTSDYGFYKTIDGGDNWVEIMTGEFQEIELNPADPTMIYTVKVVSPKTEFYKSTNGGTSFTIQTTGWPNPVGVNDHQERVEIAVTPANPNIIYANATGTANGGSGTYGIYKSTDQGASWSFICCGAQPAGPPSLSNINMMGWDKEGEDDGGQYYYDVALAVDPTNEDILHLGGVNHWTSTDGGVNWVCPAKWSEPGEDAYVHADIHDIRYFGNEIWVACDGGIFKSTDAGVNFEKTMVGIEGTDFWGFGASPQSDVMLGGSYHNGTLLKDNNVYLNDWICTGGGDGVRGFVNFGNDRIAYDDYEGRVLPGDRTINIQGFQFDSLPNASYINGNSSNLEWDPRNYNHIYLGRGKNLLKTEDNGGTYSIISTFTDEVMVVKQARSNLDVFYVTTYEDWWGDKKVWRTTDGGQNWTDITPSNALLSGETWVPYDVTISGTNENEIWLTRTSQYSSTNLNGRMVFHSTDGGSNWLNYTTATLDGEVPTEIIHQDGTDGGVYLGTRRAVYYRNNTMNDWDLFNNNLPLSTTCTRLVPKYKDKKLRNATNRSVYEVELYEMSEPIAQIAADKFMVNCKDEFVQYVDHSVLSSDNATWQWSFPGGTPATSTAQNPVVQYTTSGSYDVSLTVTDVYGTSTQSYTTFIEYVNPVSSLDVIEDFEAGITTFWSQHNDNNSFGWSEFDTDNGPYCTTTKCLTIPNFDINAVGDEGELHTPKIDLTNALTNVEIHFDYAYAKYGGSYEDGFRIDISTDCWATWDSVFHAYGDSLATVPNTNNWWEPTDCADWEVNKIIDITSYIGQEVQIRFVGLNGWGNNLYLDNINVIGQLNSITENGDIAVEIYPNPSKGSFVIEHSLINPQLEILSLDGRLISVQTLSSSKETVSLDVASGIYLVHLVAGEQEYTQRIVVE